MSHDQARIRTSRPRPVPAGGADCPEELRTVKRPKFVVYKAADGYRWRLVSANGRIVADSAEAYSRRADARKALYRVPHYLSWAMIRDLQEREA